jgi:hypothetical protein
MQEIRTSGSMSEDGKRSVAAWPKLPRPSSILPNRRFAAARQDARNGGRGGRSADALGTDPPRPFREAALTGYDGWFWPLGNEA